MLNRMDYALAFLSFAMSFFGISVQQYAAFRRLIRAYSGGGDDGKAVIDLAIDNSSPWSYSSCCRQS